MDLQDPVLAFFEAAHKKDMRGLAEHRGGNPALPFEGNLFDEYEQEQLDSYNYLTRLFNAGLLAEEEYRRAAGLHMECWFWMHRNVRER